MTAHQSASDPYHKPWTERTVLPDDVAGGPKGLGDPNSRRLRKTETEILIPDLMRKIIGNEKCKSEADGLVECMKANKPFLVPFYCRKERDTMYYCYKQWFENEEFKKRCTDIYLEDRKLYRETGLNEKLRKEGKRVAADEITQSDR